MKRKSIKAVNIRLFYFETMQLTDEDITAYQIETNYDLYHTMIDIMTLVDGVAPIGACCGRNKSQHCNQFINNKSKYITAMENIQQRTIQPKEQGRIVQVTTENKWYNLDVCSDADILHLIEIGAVTKDFFTFPKEVVKEETKVVTTAKKSKKK